MTDRNSLMADVLDEVAGCVMDDRRFRARLNDRIRALRSTPERAEQPAVDTWLYVWRKHPLSLYERSPEAEAVIAALMPLRDNLAKDGYQGLVTLIDALDRKHRGVT
jgi:hypothetical protein